MTVRTSPVGGGEESLRTTRAVLPLLLLSLLLTSASCSVVEGAFTVIKTTFWAAKTSYRVAKKTVKGTIWAVSGTYELTKGATKLVYRIGK